MTTITLYRYGEESATNYEKRIDQLIDRGVWCNRNESYKIISSQKVHSLDGTLIKASIDIETRWNYGSN